MTFAEEFSGLDYMETDNFKSNVGSGKKPIIITTKEKLYASCVSKQRVLKIKKQLINTFCSCEICKEKECKGCNCRICEEINEAFLMGGLEE